MSKNFGICAVRIPVFILFISLAFCSACSSDEPVRERDRCTPREHGIEAPITQDDLVGTWGECTTCEDECLNDFVAESCHFFEDGTMVMLDPDTLESITKRVPYEITNDPPGYRINVLEPPLDDWNGPFINPHTMVYFDSIASDTEFGDGARRITALTCPASPLDSTGD